MRKPNDSERDKLAGKLCAQILESEREKEELIPRWQRLRAIHDVEESTAQVQLIEGMKPYVFPLSRSKADRIVSSVVDGITGVKPYATLSYEAKNNADLDPVALDLMTLLEDAGDTTAIREGTEDALLTNAGCWRIRPLTNERVYDAAQVSGTQKVTRLDWQAIDPIDMMCYPPYYGTFEGALTVGHRWSELVMRVKQDMTSGKYYECDIKGGDDPLRNKRDDGDSVDSTYSAQTSAEEFVELWEVVTESDWEKDGTFKKYLCVVALTDEKLLSIQPYPYSKPWYIEIRTERQRNRIFPKTSVMQRLQGLQLAASDIFTVLIQAGFASVGPITLISGGSSVNKITQAKPFMVIETAADVKIQSIQNRPEVGELPGLLDITQKGADALTGIGQNATGEKLPSGTTATEVQSLDTALSQAKDAYTQQIAEAVEKVLILALEFYKMHCQELQAAYGVRLGANPDLVKNIEATVNVNGKSGANNPGVLIQKLQMLLQMTSGNPNSPYDERKLIQQIAEALQVPFDLERLEKQEIMPGLLDLLSNPAVQQLLMTGEPLPQILQEINARTQQPNGQGLPPGGPDMGAGAPSLGMPPSGPPTGGDGGIGPGPMAGASGQMPGVGLPPIG